MPEVLLAAEEPEVVKCRNAVGCACLDTNIWPLSIVFFYGFGIQFYKHMQHNPVLKCGTTLDLYCSFY